jgi:excisionase family DNA binding protein
VTPLLTLQQAAEMLHADETTVRRWIKAGRLRAYRPGRRLLVTEADIRAMLDMCEVEPVPAPVPYTPTGGSVCVVTDLPDGPVPRARPGSGTFRQRAKRQRVADE